MTSTPPYSRRPTMRSAAAKDDNHAFGDELTCIERPQVGLWALFPRLDRCAGDLVLVRRVSENSSSQRLIGAAHACDLDHYPLIWVKALDRRDSVGTLHHRSPGGVPPSGLYHRSGGSAVR